MEYLVTMTTHVPDGTPQQAVDDIRAREAARSRELAAEGHLLRLWRPPPRPEPGTGARLLAPRAAPPARSR
jgi:muconolactone D-isomerase